MKKISVFITILIAGACAHALSNEGRGGGDNLALEFQQALISAVAESKSNPQIVKILSDNNILDVAAKANIVVVDDALDLKVKDLVQNSVAVNIPNEQRILINRQRWNDIQDSRIKSAIALHEVLSLKKIEQTGYYPYSTKYIALVGGSANSLQASLQVNRIQQLQASNENKKAGDVLFKYFNEAREAVTLTDIPDEEAGEKKGFTCRMAHADSDEILRYVLSKAYVYLNRNIDNGPLFPDTRAWRLIYDGLHSVAAGTGLLTLAIWPKSSLTEKSTEIIQSHSYLHDDRFYFRGVTLTVRKNNGLLTFRLAANTDQSGKPISEDSYYGYCYFTK